MPDAGLSMDARNNLCLLAALGNLPEELRTARYRCVLAAAVDGVVMATGTGSVEGRIVTEGRGALGFGYDPHFVPQDLGVTMAQLAPQMRLGAEPSRAGAGGSVAELLNDGTSWLRRKSPMSQTRDMGHPCVGGRLKFAHRFR